LARAKHVVLVVDSSRGVAVVRRGILVAYRAVAGAQLQLRYGRHIFQEVLVGDVPGGTHRRKHARAVGAQEARRLVEAQGTRHEVAVAEVVVGAAEVREQRAIVLRAADGGSVDAERGAEGQVLEQRHVEVGAGKERGIRRLDVLLLGEVAGQVGREARNVVVRVAPIRIIRRGNGVGQDGVLQHRA
nr:hypothetical protein [Tanacetum cinerariifolium]